MTKKSSNVIKFTGLTIADIPSNDILSAAADANLKLVIVIGRTQDGELYVASSSADCAGILWELEHAKRDIMELSDGD